MLKLLHIRERRRAVVPTVIEGETGVGKTKLLKMYSLLESASGANKFEALLLVKVAVEKFLRPSKDQLEWKDVIYGVDGKPVAHTPITLCPELELFCKVKFNEELVSHELTLQRLLRLCLQTVSEIDAHQPALLGPFLEHIRGALEGPLFWHPLYNPSQLLYYLQVLLSAPDGTEYAGDEPHLLKAEFEGLMRQPLPLARKTLQALWDGNKGNRADCSSVDTWTAVRQFGQSVVERFKPVPVAEAAAPDVPAVVVANVAPPAVPVVPPPGADPVQPVVAPVVDPQPVPAAEPLDHDAEEGVAFDDEGDAVEDQAYVVPPDELLVRWLFAYLLVQPVPTFQTILMHAAKTVEDLENELEGVSAVASRALECFSPEGRSHAELPLRVAGCHPRTLSCWYLGVCSCTLTVCSRLFAYPDMLGELFQVLGGHWSPAAVSGPTFVVFLDEVNTASILGCVQDVMIDNALRRTALPRNIFWVCATNPYVRSQVDVDDDPNTAASGDKAFRAFYQVHPLPTAMQQVKWQYGALTQSAERDYIKAKMRSLVRVLDPTGGAGSPSSRTRADDAEPEFDEFVQSLRRGRCLLPGCREHSRHWKCSTCNNSIRQELREFLRYGVAEEAPEADDSAVDLEWAVVPLAASAQDVDFMTAVITTAHRFVKLNADRESEDDLLKDDDSARTAAAEKQSWCDPFVVPVVRCFCHQYCASVVAVL